MGGSNGGLLMGVALTQRPSSTTPSSFRVPLFDMIRYSQIGAGLVVGEYGDPAIPSERAVIARNTTLFNLKAGQKYLRCSSRPPPKTTGSILARLPARRPPSSRPWAIRYIYYENIDAGTRLAPAWPKPPAARRWNMSISGHQLMD